MNQRKLTNNRLLTRDRYMKNITGFNMFVCSPLIKENNITAQRLNYLYTVENAQLIR